MGKALSTNPCLIKRSHVEQPTEADWLLSRYEDNSWLVSTSYGRTVQISFDSLMPDGRMHSSNVHRHRMETIKRVAFDARGAINGQIQGEHQAGLVNELVLFSSWLVTRGMGSFSEVSPDAVLQYIRASAKGYEACFSVVERTDTALDELLVDGASASEITVAMVFERAGIPRTQITKSPSSLANIKRKLEGRNCENKETLERKTISRNMLLKKVASIGKLWQHGENSEDNFLDPPFDDSIYGVVRTLGKPTEHTKTIPVSAAFQLASQATVWVNTVGPFLLEVNEQLNSLDNSYRSRYRKEEIIQDFLSKSESLSLPKSLFFHTRGTTEVFCLKRAINGYLVSACFIVVAMLTARRKAELLTVKSGAIRGSEIDGWWIETVIEKTLRKEDSTPCPRLVVNAIELLEKLGLLVSKRSPNTPLFELPTKSNTEKTSEYRPEYWINRFAYELTGPEEKCNLNDWEFSPHQFRRFFAILYIWRFEGDLGALSYQLRHFDLSMTLKYVRDAELNTILGEEYHRLTVYKLQSIANEDVVPAGVMGRSLKRAIERMRTQVEVCDEHDIERKIESFVLDKGLQLKATIWGYCAASSKPSNLRRSACQVNSNPSRRLDSDGSPDVSCSNESTCARCMFHLTDSGHSGHWIELEGRMRESLFSENLSGVMKVAISKRLDVISSFNRNAFLKVTTE